MVIFRSWRVDCTIHANTISILKPSCEFLKANGLFTVCFFPPQYRKALGYMGTHSGRNENKAQGAGLTPIPAGDTVGYKEANLTFLCRKLYQHQFAKEDLIPEIRTYYQANPRAFPPDADGVWQPHYMFMGEIMEVNDRR